MADAPHLDHRRGHRRDSGARAAMRPRGSATVMPCRSAKDPEKFGKGDVRGVIAPETANNSKEGGALLPTLFFGVPGSSGMAILIGAFVMLGIQPGPNIALNSMDLVWSLIWALALANMLSVFVFLAIAPVFSLLVFVRGALLIPFVLVLAFLGAYLTDAAWENMVLLVGHWGARLFPEEIRLAAAALRHRSGAWHHRRGLHSQGAGDMGADLLPAAAVAGFHRVDRGHHRRVDLAGAAGLEKNRNREARAL